MKQYCTPNMLYQNKKIMLWVQKLVLKMSGFLCLCTSELCAFQVVNFSLNLYTGSFCQSKVLLSMAKSLCTALCRFSPTLVVHTVGSEQIYIETTSWIFSAGFISTTRWQHCSVPVAQSLDRTMWFDTECLLFSFRDLSTDNLRFLSSRQALADLAHFRTMIAEARGLTNRKWVAFGGSYPGSLAAWFRLKYPHLVHASVATSAPVYATVNFPGKKRHDVKSPNSVTKP